MTIIMAVGLAIGVALAVFGLPPFDLPMPTHGLGVVLPGCGGTRALRLTLLGQWGRAWEYNLASVILAVGAVLTLLRALVGWVSGSG